MVDVPQREGAEDSPALKVGVLLDREPSRIDGEWFADASAFDAAGVNALWIDLGPGSQLDVLTLTAALTVVTFRARLVVAPDGSPEPGAPGAAGLARTLGTVGHLSHGRLTLVADSSRSAALTAVAPGVEVFRRVPGEPGAYEGDAERWVSVPPPQGRESWRAACAAAVKRGAQGVVVPADPRLLDILRNPEEPGDRRDLQLAQG